MLQKCHSAGMGIVGRIGRTWKAPGVARRLALGGILLAALALPEASRADWKIHGCNLVWETSATTQTVRRCYHKTTFRSADVLSQCPGAERSGLLCYPWCRAGYTGVGPVCWQNCPAGYSDDGLTCRRNFVIVGSDNGACPWYDLCGLTFARGCSRCPPGFANDGCTCRINGDIFGKDTYWRGVGTPMSCPANKEQIGLLCYGACDPGYIAKGIYCEQEQETCEDVAVQQPSTPLAPFCFRLDNPQSFVQPCVATKVFADVLDNARILAQCQCSNCGAPEQVSCAELDAGHVCQ